MHFPACIINIILLLRATKCSSKLSSLCLHEYIHRQSSLKLVNRLFDGLSYQIKDTKGMTECDIKEESKEEEEERTDEKTLLPLRIIDVKLVR